MDSKRYVVMGAGEVGCYLARSLSAEGHAVTLVDRSPAKRQMVEEQLDVRFVLGNGTHVPVLEEAEVGDCDLFVATPTRRTWPPRCSANTWERPTRWCGWRVPKV